MKNPPAKKTVKPVGLRAGHVKVTLSAAVRAAVESGLNVDVRKMKAASDLGVYLKQDVIHNLGPTILVAAKSEIDLGIKQCDKLLAMEGLDFETVANVIRARRDYVAQAIELGNSIIKASEIQNALAPDAKQPQRTFSPGEQVVPAAMVQLNIMTNNENRECHTNPSTPILPEQSRE